MKQVIVVTQSLGLPPGKLAAQVAHAALGAFLRSPREHQGAWLQAGMPKIVLRCLEDADLIAIEAQAGTAGLATFLVRDAGRTVVAAGTATCLGLGPDSAAAIDAITGKLSLLP